MFLLFLKIFLFKDNFEEMSTDLFIFYLLKYIYIYIYIYINNRLIGPVGRMFANDLVDLVSIPGHVIPKTSKMVLDTSLLNTQQYKVHIKGKVV